jgi:type I restriction enzyme R subunit
VVAYSRLAAIRYFDAFKTARDELLAEAEALEPEDKALDDEALCQRPPGCRPGAGLALPRGAGAHRVRADHLGQQQRRPGLEDSGPTARAGAAIKRFKKPLFMPTRPRPTRWPF